MYSSQYTRSVGLTIVILFGTAIPFCEDEGASANNKAVNEVMANPIAHIIFFRLDQDRSVLIVLSIVDRVGSMHSQSLSFIPPSKIWALPLFPWIPGWNGKRRVCSDAIVEAFLCRIQQPLYRYSWLERDSNSYCWEMDGDVDYRSAVMMQIFVAVRLVGGWCSKRKEA